MESSPAQMKVAADLMTKKPHVLMSSMTLAQASADFIRFNFSSAPVMSSSGEVMGLLDDFSLIKIKLIQQLDDLGRDKLAFHSELLQEVHSVKENEPLLEVIKKMTKAPTHRLLVFNNANTLVGIISPKDVLRFLAGETQKSVDLRGELDKTRNALEKMTQELEKTKNKLDTYKDMVMDNPTMIHSVDEKGVIIIGNRKFHDILGYGKNELIGKTIFEVYAESVHPEVVTGLKKIMENGHHQNTFTTMVKKNGEKIRVDIASTCLLDDQGKFVGTISVSRPVDADILLRALHGVLSKDLVSGDRYGLIKDMIEDEVSPKKK
jgi:PAS domain S-box-containing protein